MAQAGAAAMSRATNQQRAERSRHKLPTLAQFNAMIQRDGIMLELVKGRGYLYWVTLEAWHPFETRDEMVYAFNHLSLDDWRERAREAWEAINPSQKGETCK
jgi:hypothetical protein